MTEFFAPTKEELISILLLDEFSEYYARADALTKKHHGDYVRLRAIIEFSNHCRRACAYCGLNKKNSGLARYRIPDEEIIQLAVAAHNAGYCTVVLQSGEDPAYPAHRIASIVKSIKSSIGDSRFKVTVSAGEMSRDDYALIKKAGADRYLLKHEICDSEIYAKLHPDTSLAERTRCLRDLKSLGYETGSGFMIGLPGQTPAIIADDLMLLRSIPCDMAGIGPFIPHPDTPLANHPPGSAELVKRCVALARLMLGAANLPATTALEVIDKSAKYDILSCGANVIMRTITPQKYRQSYSIYPSDIKTEHILSDKKIVEAAIRAVGKIPI